MSWFISRIVFSTRRESLLGSQRHLFTLLHQSRGKLTANDFHRTTKPALFGSKCSLKVYDGHLMMNNPIHGYVYTPPSFANIAASRSIPPSKNEETADMDIEIISKEEIKPASPTPHHLRTFRLSILDQLAPAFYVNLLFFFSPSNHNTVSNDVISERSQRLKESLSKTLVPFYPLAGKIKDNLHIDCNDDGVYYVETQTNVQLSDFLRKPENEFINRLYPFHPDSMELLSINYPIMVQVNKFACGGIAIGLHASHKIFDGFSVSTFMQAWAAAARDSSQQIHSSCISPYLFPPIPELCKISPQVASKPQMNEPKYATNRFVFDGSALAALKSKVATSSSVKPSSVTAVMGLLWKCAIAGWKLRHGTAEKSLLLIPVNMRTKCSPPLPPNSFGNIFWLSSAKCVEDYNMELELLVKNIRNAAGRVNNDFVDTIIGEDRSHNVMAAMKDFEEVFSGPSNAQRFLITSICKAGFYEADFGWGKPIWSCGSRGNKDINGVGNLALLIETKSGDGIEAWVTLKDEDMAIFEQDQELLHYASLNPSPLES